MAATIDVEVTLAKEEYDWGSPAATQVAICWSNSQIDDSNKTSFSSNESTITSNIVHYITINVSTDKDKTKKHSFVKTTSGYVNIFILQGNNYYRIGGVHPLVSVTGITETADTLSWGQGGGGAGASIQVTQFANDWQQVKAHGNSNWNGNNSCGHRRIGGSRIQKNNVSSFYECAATNDVQAFDYNSSKKLCVLYKKSTFSPSITSSEGRGNKPDTQCYMKKLEYDILKEQANANANAPPPKVPPPSKPSWLNSPGSYQFQGFQGISAH